MRVFLAGATGLIGMRLVKQLVSMGCSVAGVTRTRSKLGWLEGAGAEPVFCDILDCASLVYAAQQFGPDVVMHQVTDLPDDIGMIAEHADKQRLVRSSGTENLINAAKLSKARIIAQSIAWPGGDVIEQHEQAVLAANGVVLRYGQFYGPGTYYPDDLPSHPRIHVDRAALETADYLDSPKGVYEIVEVE